MSRSLLLLLFLEGLCLQCHQFISTQSVFCSSLLPLPLTPVPCDHQSHLSPLTSSAPDFLRPFSEFICSLVLCFMLFLVLCVPLVSVSVCCYIDCLFVTFVYISIKVFTFTKSFYWTASLGPSLLLLGH